MKYRQFALMGIFAPLLFWATYLFISLKRPEYSFLTKAVSELGSVDAPHQWFWNMLGYIIPGILITIFSFGLHRSISGDSKLSFLGLLLSGLFMTLSGIFPGDFNDRESLTMLLHTVGSFGSYSFFLIAAFTYPRQMRKSAYWKRAVAPTVVFTWMTIVFGAWPFLFPSIPAFGQRIVFFFYFLWI